MDNLKMNRQLGTKWFTFYTKVRPWFACLAVFSVIVDFMQYTDTYLNNWWLLLYFILAIIQPILSVIVAIKSEGDYSDFVSFVKHVLLFEIFYISYQQGVQEYIRSEFKIGSALTTFIVIIVIGYFLWYRLNIKYFEKRINVITTNNFIPEDPNRLIECKSCGYRDKKVFTSCPKCGKYAKQYVYLNEEPIIETGEIQFCRKCGEKLIDNSRFCRKCGAEIVQE
jgi:uncharacterized paraquat-inducible protein A